MRYLWLFIPLLGLCSLASAQQVQKTMPLEEKVKNLQDMLMKRPLINLNVDKWKNYVKSAPRNYSMIVMFTALSVGVNCPICK